ncbi:hypothetical protein AAMO2058_000097200 [Amorphochlora amoebiformis]
MRLHGIELRMDTRAVDSSLILGGNLLIFWSSGSSQSDNDGSRNRKAYLTRAILITRGSFVQPFVVVKNV